MHYKVTFKRIYSIGVPQLPREGVPHLNNSIKETSSVVFNSRIIKNITSSCIDSIAFVSETVLGDLNNDLNNILNYSVPMYGTERS